MKMSDSMDGRMNGAAASWSAPVLWRYGHRRLTVKKRQRTAAVQNLADFPDRIPQPDAGLSDGPNMIPLGEMAATLRGLLKVFEAVGK